MLAAVIKRAPVAAVIMVLTMGCNSLVVNTPINRETVVYWEPAHPTPKVIQDRVEQPKKKRCYTKKRHGKRYRKCS